MAPTIPGSPSPVVTAGLAPSARSVPRSPAPRRSCLPITWPAMSSAATAAMPPKTASAIDVGSMARSAFAAVSDVT